MWVPTYTRTHTFDASISNFNSSDCKTEKFSRDRRTYMLSSIYIRTYACQLERNIKNKLKEDDSVSNTKTVTRGKITNNKCFRESRYMAHIAIVRMKRIGNLYLYGIFHFDRSLVFFSFSTKKIILFVGR